MKKCLFCPNPADSLEHVVPQWLLRCISPETEGAFPIRVARYVDGEGNKDERAHISLSAKARIVCVRCNTGWMRDLESKIRPILNPLIEKQFPIPAHTRLDELRQHAPMLALWLSKTALTTSMFLPNKKPLSRAFAEEIARGNPPHGVWVDVASAERGCIAAAFTKTFSVINGNIDIGVRDCDLCFQFCLQINHLLLRVGLSPGAVIHYREPKPFRLFPKVDLAVPEAFEFPDINYFLHSIKLKTWLGCAGEVPAYSTAT